MKQLENYVCTLKQAKELKGWGVNQNALFWYGIFEHSDKIEVASDGDIVCAEDNGVSFEKLLAAFTSQELGEMITAHSPEWNQEIVENEELRIIFTYDIGAGIKTYDTRNYNQGFDNEAQARAAFLIHLLSLEHNKKLELQK